MSDTGRAALSQLRRTRQLHRLGNLEWFEVAYRVYLFGILGGGAILWISSSVKDQGVSPEQLADVTRYGPPLLGVVAALALLAGLRGGAHGGPLALEAGDVVHVMLAPVDRRSALTRPAVQRLRAGVFAWAGGAAVAGQLAGRRLPGSPAAWFFAGLLYGATVAALWMGAALLSHVTVVRAPRWARGLVTALGLVLLAWQVVAVVRDLPGPFDGIGHLAFWGWTKQASDLVGTAVAVVAVVVGFVLLGRTSIDALARRSSLVAQLRFAVTMQDLRTVILLRRQLNQEHFRHRPWARLRPGRSGERLTHKVVRRGWHGLMRFPITRLVRMAGLAAAVGLMLGWAVKGTTPALAVAALAGFVLGLEVMEPLSQEVDQADRADALPIPRGEIMFRHLIAPAVLLVPFAVVAAAVAVAYVGADAVAPAAILALPMLLGGAAGSVVSIVRDAPDPTKGGDQAAFMPPEMAGFTTTIRLVWPFVVSLAAMSPVLFTRSAERVGESLVGAAVRGSLATLLLVAVVAYWVKERDDLHRWISNFLNEGRQQTAAQRGR